MPGTRNQNPGSIFNLLINVLFNAIVDILTFTSIINKRPVYMMNKPEFSFDFCHISISEQFKLMLSRFEHEFITRGLALATKRLTGPPLIGA